MEDYDKAINLKSDYAIPYYCRGLLKFIMKNYKGAIEDYDKAINLKSD